MHASPRSLALAAALLVIASPAIAGPARAMEMVKQAKKRFIMFDIQATTQRRCKDK